MAPSAYIAHRTPHRLRIKIPSQKGNGEYFGQLQQFFSRQKGVECVEVNPLTGSLVVVTRHSLVNLPDVIGMSEWFELREVMAEPCPTTRRMVRGFSDLNALVEEFTGGEIDIAGIAMIGLVITGIYQVSIGNFAAPAWYTAFWYAASIAVKSDRPTTRNDGLM